MRKSRAPRTKPAKAKPKRSTSGIAQQRVLTPEQFERLAEELERTDRHGVSDYLAGLDDSTFLVEAARARNARLAEWLMHKLAAKLRSRQRLQDVEQDFLAEALEKIIKSPTKAGQALGLVPPKARPSKGINDRDWRIHRAVRSLMDAGMPFKDGNPTSEWDGSGAITLAASRLHVSTSTVKRAYAAVQKAEKIYEPAAIQLGKLIDSIS